MVTLSWLVLLDDEISLVGNHPETAVPPPSSSSEANCYRAAAVVVVVRLLRIMRRRRSWTTPTIERHWCHHGFHHFCAGGAAPLAARTAPQGPKQNEKQLHDDGAAMHRGGLLEDGAKKYVLRSSLLSPRRNIRTAALSAQHCPAFRHWLLVLQKRVRVRAIRQPISFGSLHSRRRVHDVDEADFVRGTSDCLLLSYQYIRDLINVANSETRSLTRRSRGGVPAAAGSARNNKPECGESQQQQQQHGGEPSPPLLVTATAASNRDSPRRWVVVPKDEPPWRLSR